MNMISTGAFLPEMDASNKQETTAEKFARVWEKKNAKAARAGGVSLMALSLAACGGSETPAVVVPEAEAPAEPEAPAVTAVSVALTDDGDILDADDFTTAADTVTATQDTYGDADVIAEATANDGDTMTVTADADVTATPTIVGVENIVFNSTEFAGAGNGFDLDADGIASGTITINHTQFGAASDTAAVTNAGNVTIVAGTDVDTLTVTQKEDAATVVNAGEAANLNLVAEDGAFGDQVASIIVNDDLALDIADGDAANALDEGEITDLNISATADATVTLAGAEDLDTITGSGAGAIEVDFGAGTEAALDGFTITGVGTVVIAGDADGAIADITDAQDLTGIATSTVIEIDTATAGTGTDVQVASGAQIALTALGANVLTISTDDGATAAATDGTVTITSFDGTAAEAAVALTLVVDDTDGSDLISTVNLVANEDVTLTLDMIGAADDGAGGTEDGALTLNVSGSGDVSTAAWTPGTGSVLNASALAGALTATAGANLLTVTGGSGDDIITNTSGEDTVIDGGAGNDTLDTNGDITDATISNIELLDTNFNALASQLDGSTYILAAGTVATIDTLDDASIDLSGLVLADGSTGAVMTIGTATAYGATVAASTAINITGTAGDDTITTGAAADVINGGAGVDTIIGGAEADTIDGGAGNDAITGGTGADTLTGGAGRDTFNVATLDTGITLATADTITDFTGGAAAATAGTDDLLDVAGAGFTTIVADGSAFADFAAFVTAAETAFALDAVANDEAYVAYNAAGSGDAYVLFDVDDSNTVNAGDVLVVLTGIDTAAEIAVGDIV